VIERPARRSALVVTVALLAVVTGCVGTDPTATTETPTPTPTANTDCPPTLTVSEVDADRAAGSAVAYGNLTAEQRETFQRARNGSVEEFDYAWHDIDFVERDGRYYSTAVVVC